MRVLLRMPKEDGSAVSRPTVSHLIDWRRRAGGHRIRHQQDKQHEDNQEHNCPAGITTKYTVHIKSPPCGLGSGYTLINANDPPRERDRSPERCKWARSNIMDIRSRSTFGTMKDVERMKPVRPRHFDEFVGGFWCLCPNS